MNKPSKKTRLASGKKRAQQRPPEAYQQWQRAHFHLCAVERRYRETQKQILATTSLKDLIK